MLNEYPTHDSIITSTAARPTFGLTVGDLPDVSMYFSMWNTVLLSESRSSTWELTHIASGITSSRSASNVLNPDFSNPDPNMYGDLLGYSLCSLFNRQSTSYLTFVLFIIICRNIPLSFP